MNKLFEICREKIITSCKKEEKKRKIIFSNPHKKLAYCVKVDGCLYNDSYSKKCDYLLEVYDNSKRNKVVFVELKYDDISGGLDQLLSTVEQLKNIYKDSLERKAIIIAKKFPSKSNPDKTTILQRKISKLKRLYGVKYFQYENIHTEII